MAQATTDEDFSGYSNSLMLQVKLQLRLLPYDFSTSAHLFRHHVERGACVQLAAQTCIVAACIYSLVLAILFVMI